MNITWMTVAYLYLMNSATAPIDLNHMMIDNNIYFLTLTLTATDRQLLTLLSALCLQTRYTSSL